MTERRRLLYLVTSLDLGGAEQQVRLLAIEFKRRGWDPTIVSMVAPDRDEPLLATAGIPVRTLNMQRGIADPRGFQRYLRLARHIRPQVIHAQMVHANLLAGAAHPFLPNMVAVVSARSTREGGRWRYLAYRFALAHVDVVTAVSRAVADELVRRRAVGVDRVIVVPSGIDVDAHQRDAVTRTAVRHRLGMDDRFMWLAAGRLVRAKAYPLMIDAFADARAHFPGAALIIAGDGPLDSEIQSGAAMRGITDAVQLLGRRDDVGALMSAADGYVMSSAWEGLPMALLEAAAASLPMVATDVAGNAEIVVDGRTGFVVPTGDRRALAAGMERMMGLTDAERATIGEAARAHVAGRFGLQQVADRWETLYERAIARRRRSV